MRRLSKKIIVFGLILSVISGLFVSQRVFAQTTDCSNQPNIKVTESAPVTRDYNVWVLAKKVTSDATPFIKVDNDNCTRLTLPSGNDWQWVSTPNQTLRKRLTAGNHNFSVSIGKGSIYIDRVLVTSLLSCQPQDKGENCLEPNLDFAVDGVYPGQIIEEGQNPKISAQLIDNNLKGAEISFYFDNNSSKAIKRTTAPYCYTVANNECGDVNLKDIVSYGQHTLYVSAKTPLGQNLIKKINFTFKAPEPVEDPKPTPLPPKPQPPTNNDIQFTVNGVKDGSTVSGKLVINTEITENKPADASYDVLYYLDGIQGDNKISGVWEKPYCIKPGSKSGQCGSWDTASATNGKHQLIVLVRKKPWDTRINQTETIQTFNITIGNGQQSSSSSSNTNDTSAPNIVVVGNATQKTRGQTIFTIPKRYAKYASKSSRITYRINDKIVAQLTSSNPEAIINTSGYVKGTYTTSATITNVDGSENVFASEVQIENSWATSLVNWMKQNKIAAAIATIMVVAIIYGIVYAVLGLLRHKRFVKSKNHKDYDPKTEELLFKFFNKTKGKKISKRKIQTAALTSAIFFIGAIGVFTIFRTQALATSVGFINVLIEDTANVVTGTAQFEGFPMGMGQHDHFPDGSMRAYYKINAYPDSNPPTNPQPEDPKPPTTPENPTPPTTHPPAGGGSMPGGITVDESKLVGPSNPYTTRRIKNAGYSKTPGSSGVGEFRVNCYYSHMSFDDPIVFPGKTRATHLHTFFGNSGANANSTTDSILNSGGSTCTGGTVNRTGYWVPSVIDTRTNAPVILTPDYSLWSDSANFLQVYYKTGYEGVRPEQVQNLPQGLRMIAGTGSSTEPQPTNIVHYACTGGSGPEISGRSSFPNCQPGQTFVMSVDFPQCWNGRDLDSPNHKSHMAYGQYGVGCPSTHPVPIPKITQNVRYKVPPSGMSTWRLSSDTYNGPAGYSGHADWMDGWDKNIFQRVVDNCYKGTWNCQMNLLGDGQELY